MRQTLFSSRAFNFKIILSQLLMNPHPLLLPFPLKSSFTLYWTLHHNITAGGFYNTFKQTFPPKIGDCRHVISQILWAPFHLLIKDLPPSLLLGHFDNLFSCKGEECGTYGAVWPAQVVLRLDQPVHQRQALRLRARTRTAFVSNFYLQAKIGYK